MGNGAPLEIRGQSFSASNFDSPYGESKEQTIRKAADINANSNQLKKSWLKFNFVIKNDEYYVVILFFMFMSGISGYYLSQLASGAFFPLAYNFQPFDENREHLGSIDELADGAVHQDRHLQKEA